MVGCRGEKPALIALTVDKPEESLHVRIPRHLRELVHGAEKQARAFSVDLFVNGDDWNPRGRIGTGKLAARPLARDERAPLIAVDPVLVLCEPLATPWARLEHAR